MFVGKKNGITEKWNPEKVVAAISKSAERACYPFDSINMGKVLDVVLKKTDGVFVDVVILHNIVESSLAECGYMEVATSYASYRDYKTNFVSTMNTLYGKAKNTLQYRDTENANFESTLTSTKQSLIRGYTTKELYRNFYLSKAELKAIDDGYIYIHDLRDLMFDTINCCLFDVGTVLKGGFEMANLQYKEPTSVLSALQLIGDITLAASAQQYGGFTIAQLDEVLVPYAKKTIASLTKKGERFGVNNLELYVQEGLQRELEQGFQSLEMKLNSVPSSRGDFAFTTISFGDIKDDLQYDICSALLRVRAKDTPVVFPKLVFLHNQEKYDTSEKYRSLFDECITCSCKALYPDYLAIDTVGQVADYYRASGKIVSPMGCRAYLSDWKDAEGTSHFIGRANIGAVSLNLPMIWMKAKKGNTNFFNCLSAYLEMIRKFLIKRYRAVANNQASHNPLAFTQGGLFGGYLQPEEKVGDMVKMFTASFGITALNELNVLVEGKPLHESDQKFINEVVSYIRREVDRFKEEDCYLYALYGVPAESLCGTQVQQFKAKYGVIDGVSDKEYFTNSFHMHVSANINPFTKQDKEWELFHKINGGHIGYGRMDVSKPNVVKGIVLRAMSLGYYYGVNAQKSFCDACGETWHDSNTEVCPKCGSVNILTIDRVCGYIGYSKQKGHTRFNDAKLAEVKDRISM